ncbi:HXXXD-type acyl-transferase family protein [Tasmannia lanceolata]|uniref:HXXXD-type acyl-transferase family protein n=1 Tax=Tasmannia lanceolata TaxID=3420 RepID=UPI004063236D
MATQEDMQDHQVSITKTISVYPKPLTPQTHQIHVLNLSNLDRKCPMLMYVILFYQASPLHQRHSTGSLFNSLKMGLERILSVWYPAAGRLTLNPNNGNKLDLVCDNSGAILVEAVTQGKISDLGDLSQYKKFYENLVFKPIFSGNFSEMPLVVAQVTRFGCGGYSVGVGTSHSLFDGLATFHFLSAWASATTGRGGGSVDPFEPIHERGRLLVDPCQTQHQISKFGKNQTMRVVAFDHLHQLIQQAASTPCVNPDRKLGECKFSQISSANQEDYVLRTFCVSSAMIESLKMEVVGGKITNSCSSFDVVAAHLWKARTKALELRKQRRICLQFTVDIRNKMVPPLHRGFSGNAFVMASVSSTAGQLEEESIEATVEKINQAKRVVTEDYIRAYLEALEAPQSVLPPMRELTLVTDGTRAPFHKVDFGHGNAVYASPLIFPIPQVAYFMQNPNEIGSIDVRIGLSPQNVHAFSHYFLTKVQP